MFRCLQSTLHSIHASQLTSIGYCIHDTIPWRELLIYICLRKGFFFCIRVHFREDFEHRIGRWLTVKKFQLDIFENDLIVLCFGKPFIFLVFLFLLNVSIFFSKKTTFFFCTDSHTYLLCAFLLKDYFLFSLGSVALMIIHHGKLWENSWSFEQSIEKNWHKSLHLEIFK